MSNVEAGTTSRTAYLLQEFKGGVWEDYTGMKSTRNQALNFLPKKNKRREFRLCVRMFVDHYERIE